LGTSGFSVAKVSRPRPSTTAKTRMPMTNQAQTSRYQRLSVLDCMGNPYLTNGRADEAAVGLVGDCGVVHGADMEEVLVGAGGQLLRIDGQLGRNRRHLAGDHLDLLATFEGQP